MQHAEERAMNIQIGNLTLHGDLVIPADPRGMVFAHGSGSSRHSPRNRYVASVLAGDALPLVTAPTLLIVGGNDDVVIGMNKEAQSRMRAETRLEIIPGASHLFEEPGTLEEAARLARMWCEQHLGRKRASDYAA
jgi:pimeloyl-ACP methyl ester carboxylesterase